MASESLLSCISSFLRHLRNQWPWISVIGHPRSSILVPIETCSPNLDFLTPKFSAFIGPIIPITHHWRKFGHFWWNIVHDIALTMFQDARTDEKDKNIMPPATLRNGRGIKSSRRSIKYATKSFTAVHASELTKHRHTGLSHSDRPFRWVHHHQLDSFTLQFEWKKSPTLIFPTLFLQTLGIFSSSFIRICYVPIYAGLHIFIQLSATLTKLCHIKRGHNYMFKMSTTVET